jgi:hypothetical protein
LHSFGFLLGFANQECPHAEGAERPACKTKAAFDGGFCFGCNSSVNWRGGLLPLEARAVDEGLHFPSFRLRRPA